jgi:hypothetical protein
MEKKQHMRWTKRGARMLLHARCALLNGVEQIQRVVALRIIAGGARRGMNAQVLSSPDLSTVRHLMCCTEPIVVFEPTT